MNELFCFSSEGHSTVIKIFVSKIVFVSLSLDFPSIDTGLKYFRFVDPSPHQHVPGGPHHHGNGEVLRANILLLRQNV